MDELKILNPQSNEELREHLERERELLKATIAFEHAALKPPFLLNGGALLAGLTLVGAAMKEGGGSSGILDWYGLQVSLIGWLFGVTCAAVASGLGYGSQHAFLKLKRREIEAARIGPLPGQSGAQDKERRVIEKWKHWGSGFRWAAIVVVGLSYLAFIVSGVRFALAVIPPA